MTEQDMAASLLAEIQALREQVSRLEARITPAAPDSSANRRGAILAKTDQMAADHYDPTAGTGSLVESGAKDEHGLTCHAYMQSMANSHYCRLSSVFQYIRGNKSAVNAMWPLRKISQAQYGVPLWRNHEILRWLASECEEMPTNGPDVTRYHAILQTPGPVSARTSVLLDMIPESALDLL